MNRPRRTVEGDKAAAVRTAFRVLVADRGLHGASMAAVAKEAGVATGTAYLYYPSKDELMFAAYIEAKHALGTAALVHLDPDASPEQQFRRVWTGVYEHLAQDSTRPRFLVQIDSSPYAEQAHDRVLAARLDDFSSGQISLEGFADLPPMVLYDLAIGPILRLTAAERKIGADEVERLIRACWRAVTTD
jgi:TetR/AcrR family transcriptional repressor of multidrug resistance operon